MVTRNEATSTADREVVITRVFDAPRELVYRAWTEPEHVVHWWGPNGFTNTVHEMDVRPGGVFRLTMHGPDGTDYPNKIIFIEVVPPALLLYDHGDDGDEDSLFQARVTFDEEGGRTRVTMHSVFKTKADRDKVVEEYGAIEGGNQHLARLSEYLKTM